MDIVFCNHQRHKLNCAGRELPFIGICSVKNPYRFPENTCLFQNFLIGFCFQSITLNGRFARSLLRNVSWVQACSEFTMKFQEGSEAVLVFVWTWDRYTFRRVCVIVLRKYSGEESRDAAVLGQLLSVVGTSLSLFSLVGGWHVLRDTDIDFPGSGYWEKLVEYPIFDLRLLRKCLRKFASVVFGSLDPFSMTEFIMRLKGAEHRDWLASRHALRRAIVSGTSQCLLWWRSLITLLGSGP